jgi:hypothetical protein
VLPLLLLLLLTLDHPSDDGQDADRERGLSAL